MLTAASPLAWWDTFTGWTGWSWPGWSALAAIGTASAVIVALWFSEKDSRRREKQERRRQAELITGWITSRYEVEEGNRFTTKLVAQNGSSQLAYRVIASMVQDPRGGFPPESRKGEDFRYRAFIGELPPGRTETRIEHPGGGAGFRAQIELAFQDAAGRYWLRKASGHLEKIKQDPARFYDLHEPLPWTGPPSGVP